MTKILKWWFCKHKRKRPINKINYTNGYRTTVYRTECRDCGKVWEL